MSVYIFVHMYVCVYKVYAYVRTFVYIYANNAILIGWQAYRGDQRHRKNSPS